MTCATIQTRRMPFLGKTGAERASEAHVRETEMTSVFRARMLSEITTLWHACIMDGNTGTKRPEPTAKTAAISVSAMGIPKMFHSLSLSPLLPL